PRALRSCPTTTLFRSRGELLRRVAPRGRARAGVQQDPALVRGDAVRAQQRRGLLERRRPDAEADAVVGDAIADARDEVELTLHQDRKSTRLNSSHVKI